MRRTVWTRDAAYLLLFSAALFIGAATLGIYVVSYLMVPTFPVQFTGDRMLVYDDAIGFIPPANGATIGTQPPDLGGFSYHIVTNARRARVATPDYNPATVDVLTIGCSMAWGHGVEAEQTFTNLIGEKVPALNLAMASYGTVHSLQTLKRNLDLKPKWVVYGFIDAHLRRNVSSCADSLMPFCLDISHVDRDETIRPPRTDGVTRLWTHIVAQTSGLDPLTWYAHGADVIAGLALKQWANATLPDADGQERALLSLLGDMKRTVESAGAKLLVVHIPQSYSAAPDALLRSVAKLGIPLVNMHAEFLKNRQSGEPNVYIFNDGHLTTHGHALIARAVLPHLTD